MLDPKAVSGAFALDVNAVSKFKYFASKHGAKALDGAAQQFEAMFIKQTLSSMRAAMPKSDLLGNSSALDTYQGMMDAQWSQTLAKRGVGLADMLTEQLSGDSGARAAKAAGAASDSSAWIDRAQPKPLAKSDPLAAIEAQRRASDTGASDPAAAGRLQDTGPLIVNDKQNDALVWLNGRGDTDSQGGQAAGHIRDFVKRLGPAADTAARQTGLSSRLILAQAALETGWGRSEITTDAGQPSHNVFAIKASGWNAKSVDATTHEFRAGAMQRTRAGFRVYDSYDQAFADYARLIDHSSRYAAAQRAASPEAEARALQDGGYATDPNYADKLISVMAHIPGPSHGGLFADASGPVVNFAGQGSLLANNSNKLIDFDGRT